jgi:hypothetical protein
MDDRFGAFTLRVDCPACGLPVPINAPVEDAHCHSCMKDFVVPSRVFAVLLTRFDDGETGSRPFKEGAQAFIDGMQAHATAASRKPECGKCSASLSVDADDAAAMKSYACASCGAEALGFPAPAWLKTHVSTATWVTVTDATAMPGADTKKAAADATHVVTLPCTQCGAPLHVTGDSERTVPCEFCKTDVYLPDDLWRRLHPVKTMSPWFVRFEGESGAALEAARQAEADRDKLAREEAAAARKAEADRDKEVRDKAEGAGMARGCGLFLLAVGALIGLGIAVSKTSSGKPKASASSTPTTGASLEDIARTPLSMTPEELVHAFSATRGTRFLNHGDTMVQNGWFKSGHPCNATVCIDLRSSFWGRVEVWWDEKHPDHPNGFTIAMQPGRWVELDDPARVKIGDQLPNGLDGWGRWYRYPDRDILIERNSGVRVFVKSDDAANPEWRTELDAAWKLVMGVLFKVDVKPTKDELRVLISPAPELTKKK